MPKRFHYRTVSLMKFAGKKKGSCGPMYSRWTCQKPKVQMCLIGTTVEHLLISADVIIGTFWSFSHSWPIWRVICLSCRPNATYQWDLSSYSMSLFDTRPIAEGREIIAISDATWSELERWPQKSYRMPNKWCTNLLLPTIIWSMAINTVLNFTRRRESLMTHTWDT